MEVHLLGTAANGQNTTTDRLLALNGLLMGCICTATAAGDRSSSPPCPCGVWDNIMSHSASNALREVVSRDPTVKVAAFDGILTIYSLMHGLHPTQRWLR